MAAGTQKGVTLGGGGLPKLAVVTLRAFRRQMWVDGNRDIDGDADVDLDGVGDGDGDPVKVPRKNGGGGGGGRAGFRNNEWVGSGGGLEVWWFEKVVIGKWREGGGGREEEEDRGLERRAVRRGGCKTQKLRFSLACSVEALFTRSECHHELAPMRAHSYVPRYLAMSEG